MKLLKSFQAVFLLRTGSQSDIIQHQGFCGSQQQSFAKCAMFERHHVFEKWPLGQRAKVRVCLVKRKIGVRLTKRGAPRNSC